MLLKQPIGFSCLTPGGCWQRREELSKAPRRARTAQALGVSRETLSSILNGRSRISPETAVRLSIVFNTTAESWLRQQLQYDLAQAETKRRTFQVKKLAAA
jgi:addiction module HigA family antidote